ncbi:MAG TPA: hypothetical protein PK431_06445 [Chitinophagales bacterium]|nr:hypothetical protein [Chitinophagales bacterium]
MKRIGIVSCIFLVTGLTIFLLIRNPPFTGMYFYGYPHISTVYPSSKFSPKKFSQIKIGTNIKEVEKFIGQPFELSIIKSTHAFGMPYINEKIPDNSKYLAYYSDGIEFGKYDWECFMIAYNSTGNVVYKKNTWIDGD